MIQTQTLNNVPPILASITSKNIKARIKKLLHRVDDKWRLTGCRDIRENAWKGRVQREKEPSESTRTEEAPLIA